MKKYIFYFYSIETLFILVYGWFIHEVQIMVPEIGGSFVLLVLSVLIICFVKVFLSRFIIYLALKKFDDEITSSIEMDGSFVNLNVHKKDPFKQLKLKLINYENEKNQYIMEHENQRRLLEDTNDELYASLNQLSAYEEEIKSSHDELEEKTKKLEQSEKRNSAFISLLPDLIFMYDAKGIFLDCQANDAHNLLLPRENFIGKTLYDVMPSYVADKGIECIRETLETSEMQKFEYALEINNDIRYFETRMIKSNSNEVMAIVRDMTSIKKEHELILEISYKDHLTNLYNRRYFEEYLRKADEQGIVPLTLVMIDVNGLKLTNDAFGHLMGDELLKRISELLVKYSPDASEVFRIGGDEFVIIIPYLSTEDAEKLVDNLYSAINNESLGTIKISISIGWETRQSMSQNIRDVFIRAENFMFRRKLVESQSMRHQTIKAIVESLNKKSERERIHSEQVAQWSRKIAVSLGFDEQKIKEVETVGLLHDIGKIAVREEILNKPGKLTMDEYDEIKKHSESGYQILKSVDLYSSLAEDVLSHHERFDGKGYPRGLIGEEIPIVARIICVADAFEAMISDRSYRKGISKQTAIEELIRCSGTQFDPVVVNAFIKIFNNK